MQYSLSDNDCGAAQLCFQGKVANPFKEKHFVARKKGQHLYIFGEK